jgi:hypothetical protein
MDTKTGRGEKDRLPCGSGSLYLKERWLPLTHSDPRLRRDREGVNNPQSRAANQEDYVVENTCEQYFGRWWRFQ